MSRRLDVILALKALAAQALPDAAIRGFDGDTRARSVPPGGVVIGQPGAAGDPVATVLSPLAYTYDHPITIEIAPTPGGDQARMLDAMLTALGLAIVADRTLGGLCDWIEASAPDDEDASPDAGAAQRWGTLEIVATYTTPNPLG